MTETSLSHHSNICRIVDVKMVDQVQLSGSQRSDLGNFKGEYRNKERTTGLLDGCATWVGKRRAAGSRHELRVVRKGKICGDERGDQDGQGSGPLSHRYD